MVEALQSVTLFLVVLAMVPAAAHALELPGKLRLAKEAYFAVQPIYYPGFTIVGISEPVAIISAAILLFLTPAASADFWLTLGALLGLLGMHAVYWLFTHPVNDFWLRDHRLGSLGSRFFSSGAQRNDRRATWTEMRDRWEYSHVARALLGFLAFVALAFAIR